MRTYFRYHQTCEQDTQGHNLLAAVSTFRRVTTRVFKDYIGSVTGVMAGSINSRWRETHP